MYKEFTGQQADDFISWNSTIRATNPEKLRGLLLASSEKMDGLVWEI